MVSDEVIELSIDETNALRAKLGLKPLELTSVATRSSSPLASLNESSSSKAVVNDSEELSLSVEDTNALRAKLGLKPLVGTTTQPPTGKSSSDAIHAPAQNAAKEEGIKKRIENAKLKRQVEDGILRLQRISQEQNDDDTDADGVSSWAEMMRSAKQGDNHSSKSNNKTSTSKYTSDDLKGNDISIAHSSSDFQAGSSTILTLADQSILNDDGKDLDGSGVELENINMSEQTRTNDNMKRKREIEMGLGHAGGYTGYDDDEFEELGGSQAHSGANQSYGGKLGAKREGKRRGIQLDYMLEEQEIESGAKPNDLFAMRQSVSLKSENAYAHQSDFLTTEEDTALDQKQLEKAKKKEKKLFKKLKKAQKKEKKRRKVEKEDSESEDDVNPVVGTSNRSLLEDLEKSTNIQRTTKRKRVADDDEESRAENSDKTKVEEDSDMRALELRKSKYHSIMEKGNARTIDAFKLTKVTKAPEVKTEEGNDIEDEDVHLLAALSKAKRLKRLRDLHTQNPTSSNQTVKVKGAEAVVESIRSLHCHNKADGDSKRNSKSSGKNGNGLTFELDATKEFTQFLRSSQKVELPTLESNTTVESLKQSSDSPTSTKKAQLDVKMEEEDMEVDMEVDMDALRTLAHEVEEDKNDLGIGFGSTAHTTSVGRGLSAALSMLKSTGEITGKNAGKEELHGRANDKRTYEDYEPVDLSKVVKLDSRNEKDLEFSNKEIKYEHRDKHGRLLTRKEAYRELCYQFHGHGSSKKNEEKRLRQIERKRSERSVASKQGGSSTTDGSSDGFGTFGALKATQRATGKAFVLHKT